jgi:hypothetical protein
MAVLLGYTRTEAGLASPVIIRGEYADRYGCAAAVRNNDTEEEEVVISG